MVGGSVSLWLLVCPGRAIICARNTPCRKAIPWVPRILKSGAYESFLEWWRLRPKAHCRRLTRASQELLNDQWGIVWPPTQLHSRPAIRTVDVDQDHRSPIDATWSGSAVPASRPIPAMATARPHSPTISCPFQSLVAKLAAALGHATGFPRLGLLRRLRHAPARSADDEPHP